MAAPALVVDLVPLNGTLAFADGAWERARYQVAEFQPANWVELIGSPPRAVRVHFCGTAAEVAPAILARVSELAGCELEVAVPGDVDPKSARPHDPATRDHLTIPTTGAAGRARREPKRQE